MNICKDCKYKESRTLTGSVNEDICLKIGETLKFNVTECSMYERKLKYKYKNKYPGSSTHDNN